MPEESLQVRPVRRYPEPGYPTRLEVLAHPDLLRRNLPAAWRKIPGIAAAVACFLGAESDLHAVEKLDAPRDTKTAAAEIVVAPLFRHGNGNASLGCVAVNPPQFLSEEEAVTLIKEELAKHGVKLGTPTKPWETVKIAPVTWRLETSADGERRPKMVIDDKRAKALLPDGYDPKTRIAFEFVDKADRADWDQAPLDLRARGNRYDFVSAANHLRAQLAQNNRERTYFGVFYDPVWHRNDVDVPPPPDAGVGECMSDEFWQKRREARPKLAHARAREDLRRQVADFAEWLKGQGVL